jgi:hypothetical protein
MNERDIENRGLLIAARLICGRCRHEEPIRVQENGAIIHGPGTSCLAWQIRAELINRASSPELKPAGKSTDHQQ